MQAEAILKSPPTYIRLIGLLLFLALGAGTEILTFEYRQQRQAVSKAETTLTAQHLRARIESELNAVIFLSDTAAVFLEKHFDAATDDEIRATFSEVFRRSKHVRSFAITDNSLITHVFPQSGGGLDIGYDFHDRALEWNRIQRSMESRSPFFLAAANSKVGVLYLSPIFKDNQFRGFLIASIDQNSLFSSANCSTNIGTCQFAVRANFLDGQQGDMIYGNADLFNDDSIELQDMKVPEGNWRLAVKPVYPKPQDQWLYAFRWLGWLFAFAFGALTIALLELRRKFSDLALFDGLTGLPGRHLFIDRLKQTIRRTRRNHGMFSVLFISLNEFKAINYLHGEKAGDMMLVGIGKFLIDSVRHCDTVTRWGGDEFLILLDACPSDQARIIAEKLRHRIELPTTYGDQHLKVGASIGISTFPEDGQSLAALLKTADGKMLEDKSRRRSSTRAHASETLDSGS